MSVQAADALMAVFGFERVTLRGDGESGTTEDHELEVGMDGKMVEALDLYFGVDADELDTFICKAWQAAWQASRAALVVELPLPAHNDWHEYDQGFNAAHSECRNAIHAAGVKTI